jgi:hypothetical protein
VTIVVTAVVPTVATTVATTALVVKAVVAAVVIAVVTTVVSNVLDQSEANIFAFSHDSVYDPASCDLNSRFQSNDRCFSKARQLLSKAAELRQPSFLPSDHPLSLNAVNEVKRLLKVSFYLVLTRMVARLLSFVQPNSNAGLF